MNSTVLWDIGLFLPAGAVLGVLYFGLLMHTVRRHTEGAAVSGILPLHVARLGLAAIAFWAVAQRGALPLLITLAGFIIARYVMQRRYGMSRW